jgi:hypothetical protein
VGRVFVVALLAAPVLAVPAAGAPASKIAPNFQFDLAAQSIEGHALLGKRLQTVVAALGIPRNRSLRHPRYGSVRYAKGSLSVMLRRRGDALRVTSIAITSRVATEVRLGRILRLPPSDLQRKITTGYPDTFRLVSPYSCSGRLPACGGLFKTTDGRVNLAFGPSPAGGSYLVVSL